MAFRHEKLRAEHESLQAAHVDLSARAGELARSIDDLRGGHVTTAAEKTRLEQRLLELKDLIIRQERTLDESKGELSRKRSAT